MNPAIPRMASGPALLALAMALPAGGLAWTELAHVPPGAVGHLLLMYSFLPRIAVSLLAGASLGLSGALLQAVLRNPLAEPTTLGTSAGAQLALTMVTLGWPALSLVEREGAALAGAALASVISCGLAWRSGLSPLRLILGGLLISLFCAAAAAVMGLLDAVQLSSVFLWSTGTLGQYDWTPALFLLPQFGVAVCGAALLLRPLSTLALEDEAARSLGVSLLSLRLAALGLAVALAAAVVCVVGVIGFAGLAAPAFARLAGGRGLKAQLIWAPIIGALLLCLTDQLILAGGHWAALLPTGTATALLGAPLLLWLLPQLREGRPVPGLAASGRSFAWRPGRFVLVFFLLLLAGLLALGFGRGADGWGIVSGWPVLGWRWPHVLAAAAAGAMLAAAGAVLQRMTGNAMASPEVLGVSAGAALGVIILTLALGTMGEAGRLAGAATGAACVLAVLLLTGRRGAVSPQRLLLAGVAITTVVSALAALLAASGDPRMQMLTGWMSGSTYLVTAPQASMAALACFVLLVATPPIARALTMAPLGRGTGHALGLSVFAGQTSLLLMASLLTAAGTLVVGPFTFVGLMGPHFARMSGCRGALASLFVAALFGALVMILADWLGRNLLFPYQIPAGLLAAAVGCPLVLWSLWRSQ